MTTYVGRYFAEMSLEDKNTSNLALLILWNALYVSAQMGNCPMSVRFTLSHFSSSILYWSKGSELPMEVLQNEKTRIPSQYSITVVSTLCFLQIGT